MNFLTTKEAADLLGVTVRRVQAMITAERLPAKKIGRDYLINEADLSLVEIRKTGRPSKQHDGIEKKTNKVAKSKNKSSALSDIEDLLEEISANEK